VRTEQLISLLAAEVQPVARGALIRKLLIAMGAGSMATLAGVIFLYGLRGDLSIAVLETSFWMKVVFTGAVAVVGFLLVERAGRPGARLNMRLALLSAPFALILALAVFELAHTPPPDRVSVWLGQTWRSCPFSVAGLAIPPLVLLLVALRSLAPTRLTLAGFAAGMLSGGLAATAYGLHCPEWSAAFVATWYALGILICGALGAIAGRLALRW
jgi:hypothetical protein